MCETLLDLSFRRSAVSSNPQPPLRPLDVHKAEVAVIDRYQKYSAELLRISLLGIAVLGFFFQRVATLNDISSDGKKVTLWCMGIAAAMFAVAAAACLAHRYYSTDVLDFRFRILKGEHYPPSKNPDDFAPFPDALFWFLGMIRRVNRPRYAYESMIAEESHIGDLAIGAAATFAGLASFTLIIAFLIAIAHYDPKLKPDEESKTSITIFRFGKE
jgi:hypothetical protein